MKTAAIANFRDFEEALKRHDWTYANSDDHSYWLAGEASMKRIYDMARELVQVDPQKVAMLYDKYGKQAWTFLWETGAGKNWVDSVIRQNKHDHERKKYVADLMAILRKVGNQLGKVVDEGSFEMSHMWDYYVVVKSDDGHKFELVASEWRGGSGAGTTHNQIKFNDKWLRPGEVDLRKVEQAVELKGKEMLEAMRKKAVASELVKVAKEVIGYSHPEEAYVFASELAKVQGVASAVVNDFAKVSLRPDVFSVDIFVYADPEIGGRLTNRLKGAVNKISRQLGVRVDSLWTPRADREITDIGVSGLRDFYRTNPYKVTVICQGDE
jgi:hypothetical protein